MDGDVTPVRSMKGRTFNVKYRLTLFNILEFYLHFAKLFNWRYGMEFEMSPEVKRGIILFVWCFMVKITAYIIVTWHSVQLRKIEK